MSTAKHIETITNFIAAQMDGEQVPPSKSADLARLKQAVQALHANAKDKDWQVLGLKALGAVISRTRAAITAEETLHAYLRGNGHV